MDTREVLQPGTVLPFPEMECTVETVIGRGSNAVVYQGSYPDRQHPELRHRVLVKELFPFHPKGLIYRDEKGEICKEPEAEELMQLHRHSFEKGNEIHLRLLEEYPGDIDANINTFSMHQTLYTVLGFSGGRSLDKELRASGAAAVSLAVHIRRMQGVLRILDAFHASGYLHLDISPDNLLLIGDGKKERVTLIDYNSVHTFQEVRSGRPFYSCAKEGYTAPEIRLGKRADIGPATDLYSLAAVFYRCLTGKKLTAIQAFGTEAPDVSDPPCLRGMPETVRFKVRQILKRGLASLARRRYQSAGAFERDLEELWERVEGKGITHWALWETGRMHVLRALKANPALEYIREEESIYPAVGTMEDGSTIPIEEIIGRMVSADGFSALLLGSGGMGKTTALLRVAYLQKPEYLSVQPAVIYLSLYGWREGGDCYIKNRILESLRFRPDTDSMETARHELLRLLSAPLHAKSGDCPKLLLLLDGLNEALGDITPLLGEIRELSGLGGVRILVASRSEIAGLAFVKISLQPLKEAEVKRVLSAQGLLLPENPDLCKLLRTPMLLSIFVRTANDGGRQLLIDSQKELLDRYFAALLDKEIRRLPDDSPQRWSTEAALAYVLPRIAILVHKRGSAVSDQTLLALIEQCYRRLSGRAMIKVFPGWIGHIADIRGDAENAEEWYGQIVLGILWRQMGLIVRDEQGNYRIVHQLIEEHLVENGRRFQRRFAWRRGLQTGIVTAAFLLVAAACYRGLYLPYAASHVAEMVRTPYDEALSETVRDIAFAAYSYGARQYETVTKLLETLKTDEVDEAVYEQSLRRCLEELKADTGGRAASALRYEERLLASGEVMPWSGQPLPVDDYEALAVLADNRAEDYLTYVTLLDELRKDEGLWDYFGESYVEALSAFLDCDAYVLGKYYQTVLEPEFAAMAESDSEADQTWYHRSMTNLAYYPGQDAITQNASDTPEQYEQSRFHALTVLRQNGAFGYFRINTEE